MKKIIQNKRGALTDLFLFIIIAIIILFISGIFIYMGNRVKNQLDEDIGDMQTPSGEYYNETIDDTFGDVNVAYQSLYWVSIFIIVAMIISIFIGNHLITTRPIFFVPYIFITIIAIIVSVGISNVYQRVVENPTLASTFSGFIGSNYIMYYLPIWVTVIGFVGGIIMFVKMKSEEVVFQ